MIAPHVTEKSSGLAGFRQFVFRVSLDANKLTIARAVEKKYGVTVIRVNTLNVHGKRVRVGKTEGRSPGFKKAIVTLKEGQSIEIQ
ncbi:MAG: 50S ribosomal protein L23 [bacterium]|nr:50S ribosomal protein L23 [bacterium]